MNTKIIGIIIMLLMITSTSLLMESNQQFTTHSQVKGFNGSDIIYSNSTYIMGTIDGIYFVDSFNNGWHYSLYRTEPTVNKSVIADTSSTAQYYQSTIKFTGSYNTSDNVYNKTEYVAVFVHGDIFTTANISGLSPVISYDEYLPFALNNKGQIESDNTFANEYYQQNLSFTPTDYLFNINNDTISPSPLGIDFGPTTYHTNPNLVNQTFIFNYYIYNGSSFRNVYYLNITDSGQSFSIQINGITYPFATSQSILLKNGTYNYSYALNTNNVSYNRHGIIVINGKNVALNLAFGLLPLFNIQNYLYVFLILLSMLIFSRFLRGFLIGYSVVGILFLYIGFKAGLQYFDIDTIIYVVLLLAAIITYKLVLE